MDDYQRVMNALNRLIRVELNKGDSESSQPTRTPDASDYFLRNVREKAKTLREVRERFENVMTTSDVELP